MPEGRNTIKMHAAGFSRVGLLYLWALEGGVQGQARAEARQRLDIGRGGQRSATLGEDGESQRLEVLGVDVPLLATHRLQQVLTWDDLKTHAQ